MSFQAELLTSLCADSAYAEIEKLRAELLGTYSWVENMRKELNECKGSEAHAQELARDAQVKLEETMKSAENLRLEGLKSKEDYNNLVSDLEQSKSEVTSLENLAKKLKEDLEIRSRNSLDTSEKNENIELKGEVDSLKLEILELKSALEASELRYQEEYIKSTLQIKSAYDELEQEKSDSNSRKVEYEAELRKAKDTIEELKSEMVIKENLLKNMSENNKNLSIKIEEIETSPKKYELQNEIKKLKEDIEDLSRVLIDKETQFQKTREENERLKEEASLKEENSEEREVDESSERVSRVIEQLEGVQRANTELEAQLRRLKVQSDQWRKAAETATNMLSDVDRTVSLDSNYNTFDSQMDSPLSDNLEDDSFKKKNGNMLKKIGGLWKKGVK